MNQDRCPSCKELVALHRGRMVEHRISGFDVRFSPEGFVCPGTGKRGSVSAKAFATRLATTFTNSLNGWR